MGQKNTIIIFKDSNNNELGRVFAIIFPQILKVSKSRKQFLELSIPPKNERKT